MNVGVLGYSEGNGHPFSFSAIVNGYNASAFIDSGWGGILDYLNKQPQESFGFSGVQVTHAWTQNPVLTKQLCAAAKIPYAVEDYKSMIGKVDAVIIARDDYKSHYLLSKDFLEYGIPVFIDKPLTLNLDEISYFERYLNSGLLMSTSGMRYAKELDFLRAEPNLLKDVILIQGVVLNDLEKYGIHLLDAISGLNILQPESIIRLPFSYESYCLTCSNGLQFNLSCLGPTNKIFHLSFYGVASQYQIDLTDNFSAFRKTLETFFDMVIKSEPMINPSETLKVIKLLCKIKNLKPMELIQLEH